MSSGSPALLLAEKAYGLVQADPSAAAKLAERALEAARREQDVQGEVAALHALAWSQHVLGDPRASGTAREGIRIATRSGDHRGVALLRRRLSMSLAFAGDLRGARREIDAAIADLSGSDAAQSEVFRIAIHRSGHAADPAAHRTALARAAVALRRLRRDGDQIWEARLLFNRGLLHSDRGELDAAEADLRRAGSIYAALGARAAAADATVALAEIAMFRGDLVEYLRVSDAERAALPPGDLAIRMADHRAAALAQARLLPEAQAAAADYIELCAQGGRGDSVPGALLDLASISILSGDWVAARRSARAAARSLAARNKPVNAALARLVELRSRLAEGVVPRSALRRALDDAALLERAGWRRHALRARVLAAHAALILGADEVARGQLALVGTHGRRGTVLDRIELAHARALLRSADGDESAAEASLRAGLDLLDDYRASLGALELRAAASAIGTDLAELGLRIALRGGRPASVLSWAERLRGAALRLPPVRPPSDPGLRAAQVELRTLAERIRKQEDAGVPARELGTRRETLERELRVRVRYVQGGTEVGKTDVRRLASERLGERALVEYLVLDGRMFALTLVGGALTLHDVGVVDATAELSWLRFALGRLARTGGSRANRAAARANLDATVASLDRVLLAPLLPAIGDAPLVVIPTGELHALPWAALPSMRGRPTVVAPSLTTWLELDARRGSRRTRSVIVAGPRLRHATAEVHAVAPLLPGAAVLRGSMSTVGAVLAAIDGARLAHVACHGRFRADNPLFSSLELADGPLTALDLQQLRRIPETLILSSCNLALSELRPGNELLGFSAALLAMGTRTIVASVVPVPDGAARRLMLAFHRGLADGSSPSVALAQAQAGLHGDSTSLSGFVCLGSG